MSEDKTEHRPVTRQDFEETMRKVLLAKPSAKRGENRRPTKAELETRYRLDRQK